MGYFLGPNWNLCITRLILRPKKVSCPPLNLVDFDHIRALTLIIPNMLYYLAIVALIYPIIINLAAC